MLVQLFISLCTKMAATPQTIHLKSIREINVYGYHIVSNLAGLRAAQLQYY